MWSAPLPSAASEVTRVLCKPSEFGVDGRPVDEVGANVGARGLMVRMVGVGIERRPIVVVADEHDRVGICLGASHSHPEATQPWHDTDECLEVRLDVGNGRGVVETEEHGVSDHASIMPPSSRRTCCGGVAPLACDFRGMRPLVCLREWRV